MYSINVISDRCLRIAFKNSNCDICEKACRFGAVKVSENRVEIDSSRCVSCYECVGACPTEVFDIGLDKILSRLLSSSNRELYISCSLDALRESRERRDADQMNICINALRLEHYLVLIDKYEKIRVLINCDECELRGRGIDLLRRLVKEVSKHQSLRDKIMIHKTRVSSEIYVKRSYFKKLAESTLDLVVSSSLPMRVIRDLVNPRNNREKNSGLGREIKIDPVYRIRASEISRKIGVKILSRIPRLDPSKCSLCEICSRTCPSEAIIIDPVRGLFVINGSRCLECNLCADLCPEKAIELEDRDLDTVSVYIVDTKICEKCGMRYPARYNECPYCSKLQNLVKDFERNLL